MSNAEPAGADPDSAAPASPARILPFRTKLAYGFGSVAFGIQNGAFDYFLLIFYSQVIGLDARLVGLAVLLALIADAVSDPVVGYWSDNLHSRWGRRHPFMYASALPIALSFFLLWNPPEGLGQAGLFWYVLVLAIVIRTCITFYETPSSALAPDMTQDYDQRSALISYRYFFGWTGGNMMSVLMFFFLFPVFATEAIPDGMFNRDAYALYGVIASVMIFAAIVISALGTHSEIPYLKPPPPRRQMSLGRIFTELFETLAERSFLSLFVGAIFGAIASGLSAGLAFYFLTYFWGFTEIERGLVLLGTFLAAIIGFVLAPIVTRTIGKKRGAMIIGLIAFLGAPMPVVLRLLDLLPPNGTPFVFWFVFVTNVVDVGLIICFQILVGSMVADLVEQSELKTGRRSEGVFTATLTFIRKSVQGFGLLAASFVLAAADFPSLAGTEDVPDAAIWRLGAYYVPSILFLWMAMMAVIGTYRIDRQTHEANLRELARRAKTAGTG